MMRSASARTALPPRARVGGLISVIAITSGLLAPLLAPYPPNGMEFASILASPGPSHLFGTDDLGRDVLSRVLFGARASLTLSLIGVLAAFLIGAVAGLVGGYFGGWIDEIVMAIANVILAFPGILVGLALASISGPGPDTVLIAIATVNIPVFARMARSQTRLVRELDYVTAERAIGFGHLHIMMRTIVPNVLPLLIVQASLLVAAAVIMESYLSFLGLGVQPPTPTLGGMLRYATGFLDQAPWLAWFPGCAIFVVILGFNLLGDGLRDYLDPQQH